MRVLLGEFVEWMKARNYAAGTLQTRANNIHKFLDWCEERSLVRAQEVTQPILERYQKFLYYHRLPNGKPLTFHSQKQSLSSVKTFFRWLTRAHYLLFNPASEIEAPRLGRRLPRDLLTLEEVEWVINQPDVTDPMGIRDRAILETFYSTGIRRKELAGLTLYDVNVGRGTLMIREGKGMKDRVVPVGARALAWIDKYITEVRPQWLLEPDEGYLFLTNEGLPFFRLSRLSEIVHHYLERSKLGKKGGCHIFRHTMATLMLENGADIRFIQEMLGHADVSTTQIYTHVSIQKLQQIHRATHPAELSWKDPRAVSDDGADRNQGDLLDTLEREADQEDKEESD